MGTSYLMGGPGLSYCIVSNNLKIFLYFFLKKVSVGFLYSVNLSSFFFPLSVARYSLSVKL